MAGSSSPLALLAGVAVALLVLSWPGSGFVATAGPGVSSLACRSARAEPSGSALASPANFSVASVACGLVAAAGLLGLSRRAAKAKTVAKYTTQVILPSLSWIKTGIKANELAPTELKAIQLVGNDVLVGKDESGTVFCVSNLCPHLGTPMSEGADVVGNTVICPLHGSSFRIDTGDLVEWCPSPPIIGPLTGFVIEKKNLKVFETQTGFLGGEIEVLVDTNAKKAYEADYWKGILDAQGKDDGTYY